MHNLSDTSSQFSDAGLFFFQRLPMFAQYFTMATRFNSQPCKPHTTIQQNVSCFTKMCLNDMFLSRDVGFEWDLWLFDGSMIVSLQLCIIHFGIRFGTVGANLAVHCLVQQLVKASKIEG